VSVGITSLGVKSFEKCWYKDSIRRKNSLGHGNEKEKCGFVSIAKKKFDDTSLPMR
jgi:hypothetical protein